MGERAGEMSRYDQAEGPDEMRAELEQTRAEMSETIDAIQERLTPDQLASEAVGQVRQQVASRKERAAGSLGSVAQALRQTSQQLREQDQGSVAQYTNRAADQVERFASYVRERDVNQLLGEVERVARRQPALFLGGAFALGLFGARFLKSSSQQAAAGGGGTTTLGATAPSGAQVYGPGFEGMRVAETTHYGPRPRTGYAEGMEET